MGYFASRGAPLGPVGPSVVTALFHGFSPAMIERAIPDAWSRATPEAIWQARVGLADRTLTSVLGDRDVAEAASLARGAARAATAHASGRALFAAHIGLDWPDAPHLVLWHAATLAAASTAATGTSPCSPPPASTGARPTSCRLGPG